MARPKLVALGRRKVHEEAVKMQEMRKQGKVSDARIPGMPAETTYSIQERAESGVTTYSTLGGDPRIV